jgi:hypothetical protein
MNFRFSSGEAKKVPDPLVQPCTRMFE